MFQIPLTLQEGHVNNHPLGLLLRRIWRIAPINIKVIWVYGFFGILFKNLLGPLYLIFELNVKVLRIFV